MSNLTLAVVSLKILIQLIPNTVYMVNDKGIQILRVCVKQIIGNGVEISLIFCRILGSLALGWAPNHFVLGAHLAPGGKRLVCIPEIPSLVLVQPRNTRPYKTERLLMGHNQIIQTKSTREFFLLCTPTLTSIHVLSTFCKFLYRMRSNMETRYI